jgi:hypothetical protein
MASGGVGTQSFAFYPEGRCGALHSLSIDILDAEMPLACAAQRFFINLGSRSQAQMWQLLCGSH